MNRETKESGAAGGSIIRSLTLTRLLDFLHLRDEAHRLRQLSLLLGLLWTGLWLAAYISIKLVMYTLPELVNEWAIVCDRMSAAVRPRSRTPSALVSKSRSTIAPEHSMLITKGSTAELSSIVIGGKRPSTCLSWPARRLVIYCSV